MYLVFFITSKLWLKLKYIYALHIKHAEQTNGNKYMQNVSLFQNFADSCLKNDPFLFREFAEGNFTGKVEISFLTWVWKLRLHTHPGANDIWIIFNPSMDK